MFWLLLASLVWSGNSILCAAYAGGQNHTSILCLICSCVFFVYALFVDRVIVSEAEKAAIEKEKFAEKEEQIEDSKYGFRDDE